MGKIIFLVGDIVISRDNLGAETASACLSTETKITCSHVFVDEILGTWRAGRPQNGHFFGFLGRFSDCGARISAMRRPQKIPLSIEPVIF